MPKVSPDLSYPELFRVTGPLLSLALRTEDVCQRCNQFIEAAEFSPCHSPYQCMVSIDPPENPVFCTWLPIAAARIHRVRVEGNTLGASCCRTCRCRCVRLDLWLLVAADHASLLPRATRVSAPARHAPRRAPAAAPRPPRAAARLPARPCGARPRELIICHIIHIIYYTSVVQSYIYFICYSSLNSTTFKRSSATIFAQNSLTNGTGQHKRQFLNSLEDEMQCRRATTA